MAAVRESPYDPLLHDIDLPISRVLYPLGFPLRFQTNSPEVEASALESWGRSSPMFDRDPFDLRVVVQPGGARASAPVFRAQGHLLSVVADRDNFGGADLQRAFAFLFLTGETVRDRAW